MKNTLTLIAAAIFLAAAAPAAAQLKLLSHTGEVQYADGNTIVGVVPGSKAPTIPATAKVRVISGKAVFQTGDRVITAPAGSSFITSTRSDGATQINVAPDSKPVTVTVKGQTIVIPAGGGVSLATDAKGNVTVTATQGTITTGDKTLVAGEKSTATIIDSGDKTVVVPASNPKTDQQDQKVEDEEFLPSIISPSAP